MTRYKALKEKVDAAYQRWNKYTHFGFKSAYYWYQYKKLKKELDKLTVGEATQEIAADAAKEKRNG